MLQQKPDQKLFPIRGHSISVFFSHLFQIRRKKPPCLKFASCFRKMIVIIIKRQAFLIKNTAFARRTKHINRRNHRCTFYLTQQGQCLFLVIQYILF